MLYKYGWMDRWKGREKLNSATSLTSECYMSTSTYKYPRGVSAGAGAEEGYLVSITVGRTEW